MEGEEICDVCKSANCDVFFICGDSYHDECLTKRRRNFDNRCPKCKFLRCGLFRKTELLKLIKAGKSKKEDASKCIAFLENFDNFYHRRGCDMQPYDEKLVGELISMGWQRDDFWVLFYDECINGNIEKLNYFIELGMEIDLDIVLASVRSKDFRAFERLLELGADIDGLGPCTLIEACKKKATHAIAKYLIENGVDINSIMNYKTPLKMAICSQSNEMVEFLLERGADPNFFVTLEDHTILHFYGKYFDEIPVDLLLKYSADFNTIDMKGLTPLHHAMMHGNAKRCKSLIEA